ncbi:siphovirus Gp157 family protein [Streptococcus marmotae]|uniref:siphovirus Gp157 family protein n=1 Tax=Streptococcus marmotae TaxID=1825069 RepID=UPI0008359B6A|nr:siphovirus Gp157 family protein [Streptococcus marmotae]QBX16896.1 hypothetical protein Javan291_0020 [Streptococcus phage Javan291]
MAYLYELEGIYAQLQEMELDDETFRDTLESLDFQGQLEVNIEYFVKMMKNSLADAEIYKAEASKFTEKRKQAEQKAERYKGIIKNAMKLSQVKKVETELFKVSVSDRKTVQIVDETKIPLQYMKEKIEYTPIKADIKKALEAGEVIEGAEFGYSESVVVK